MSQNKKELPEANKLFFTTTGFGVKAVSKSSLKKNFKILRDIAKEAKTKFDQNHPKGKTA